MKIKSFLISITFLFLFNSNLFPAASGQGYVLRSIPKECVDKDKLLLSESADDDEEVRALKEDLRSDKTRFITFADNSIAFGPTAFYVADYFFLGASGPVAPALDTGSSALSRARIKGAPTPSEFTVEFVAMAPEKVLLNGEKDKDNPLYKSNLQLLNLMGRYPIATNERTAVTAPHPAGFLGDNKHVYLIDDQDRGTSVKTNTDEINDARGAGNPTDGIVGLAASDSQIFAAVRPQGDAFGGANSGIALLTLDKNKLKPKNAQTGAAGNLPVKIDLDANQLLAIAQNATVGGFGDMHWDSTLQRLFIGLTSVQRTGNPSGAISLLVGRVSGDGALIIEPAVELNENRFTDNSTDFVFGFYRTNAGGDVRSSTYKIRTMRTSTGKSYLIVNGGVGDRVNGDHDKFYALPLLQKSDDGAGAVEANIGKVTDKTDLTILPAAAANMSESDEAAVRIGGASLPFPTDNNIEDMFVVGDSIFVCVTGNRSDNDSESGIFRSTAIFDNDGKIRAWTQWQRVMGSVDKVYGAGLDTVLGNYWYLTQDATGNQNTVKVTQWGKSVEQAGMLGNGLVDLLSTQFSQENAGVHQIFNFDEFTPGFNTRTKFSMMVATGLGKVSLIETGRNVDAGGIDAFTHTQAQFQDTANVFSFSGGDLDEIGPICCVEVSRGLSNNNGWLFVGGYSGVSVLRQANGFGWDGRPNQAVALFGLSNAGFPGDAGWSFKKIGDFSQVRKMVCNGVGGFLYVMTDEKLYRVAMAANKFQDVGAAALAEQEITSPPGTLLDMILFHRAATNTRLLVATTQGLFRSDNIADAAVGAITPIWTAVNLHSGAPLSGQPVVHLDFISAQKGGFTTNGNLYALAADLSLNLATVYRFNVDGGVITAITEDSGSNDFYAIGELRTNFVTDGTFGYHMLSKHFGQTNFLEKINIGTNQTTMRSGERAIDLDLESGAYNIGRMVQNTASGAWVVPGDWGIRVNE